MAQKSNRDDQQTPDKRVERLSAERRELYERMGRAAQDKAKEDAAESPKEESDPLVGLKKSGDRPPLFLVAPIFGSAFPYHHLALHMDADQPLYGLQSPALAGGEPVETIPEMAEQYVRVIRRLQPHGPYFVGGYSFGGWTAFEIARRLLQEKEDVAFLGILGVGAPPSMAAPFLAQAAEHSLSLLESQIRLHRDTSLDEQQRVAFQQAKAAAETGTPLQRIAAAGTRAALRYLPRPIECGMSLFLTADVMSSSPTDHTLGWWLLCTREIDVYLHSGNHLNSLSEPDVRDLARKLSAALCSSGGNSANRNHH